MKTNIMINIINSSPKRPVLKTTLLMLSALCATAPLQGAVSVVATQVINVSDNDTTANGDAGYDSTPAVINASNASLSNLNESAEIGYRFTGFNSGRGHNQNGPGTLSITQGITATVTWTITANAGETYTVSLAPELHAYLNTQDGAGDEATDRTSLSNFSSSLVQNGSVITDTLALTGGSQHSVGAKNIDDTAVQNFTGLTGNNTFVLTYDASALARWQWATWANNRTANAVLWGQDGTMDGATANPDNFDNYSSSAARNADGLFVSGTVEITAVPEPSSAALLGLGGFGLLIRRRR